MYKLASITLSIIIICIIILSRLWIDYNLYFRYSISNTKIISEATFAYYKKNNLTPNSIEQLVKEGYLPEFSKYYRSFFRHKTDNPDPASYKDIEYQVIFSCENKEKLITFKFTSNDYKSFWLPGKNTEEWHTYIERY